MRVWKYSLWTATVAVLVWAICLVSAVVGGKGVAAAREKRPPTSNDYWVDSGAGEVLS